jgi:hypothetical protein
MHIIPSSCVNAVTTGDSWSKSSVEVCPGAINVHGAVDMVDMAIPRYVTFCICTSPNDAMIHTGTPDPETNAHAAVPPLWLQKLQCLKRVTPSWPCFHKDLVQYFVPCQSFMLNQLLYFPPQIHKTKCMRLLSIA